MSSAKRELENKKEEVIIRIMSMDGCHHIDARRDHFRPDGGR